MSRHFETEAHVIWLLFIGPLVLGCVAVFFAPLALRDPATTAAEGSLILAVGLLCLLLSKASLFRRGIWVSWGPRLMTKWWARLYKAGYVLMFVGAFLLLLVYAAPSWDSVYN